MEDREPNELENEEIREKRPGTREWSGDEWMNLRRHCNEDAQPEGGGKSEAEEHAPRNIEK